MIIDYFYIPSVIDENISFEEIDTIPINKNVTVTNNSTISFDNNHIFLQDNNDLTFEKNNICIIDNNVEIFSAGDDNNLILNGQIYINSNATLSLNSNLGVGGTTDIGEIIIQGTLRLTNQQLSSVKITIKNGGLLVIDGETYIDASSSLIIQSGGQLKSPNGQSSLFIYGSFNANPNSEISGFEKHDLGGITYRGSGPFELAQANITNTEITANCNGFNPVISQCQFNASPLYIVGDGTNECTISDNQFTNSTGTSALKLEGYPKYIIENNTFSNNSCDAISIYKSGNKVYRSHIIANNTIHNNTNLQNAKGIVLYASVAEVFDNTIYSNDYGVALYHNSSVRMYGDPEKASQQIYGNEYNQIIAVDNSFPWYFKWNVVQDAGSPYAIVSCKDIKNIRYDVRDNCWGDKFSPFNDLDPYENFIVLPEWDCGLNPDGSGTDPLPRAKYELALTQIENENYTAADAQLKTIVNQWRESEFAATAMKTMPDVAQKRGNVDDLIAYYNTEGNIQDNPELAKLAGYLKADCDVMKERYQEALDFYAGIIDNPPTPEDETYATIDAGYVQYLIDGNKAQGTFKYAELIPKTKQAYAIKRKQLLDALGGQVLQADQLEESTNESMENLNNIANELNIYPNPTSGKVNIEFTAKESGNTIIEILNTAGQCVYSHAVEGQTEGKVNHSLSTTNMASGIYYVQIRINDKYVKGKKLVVY